MNRAYSYHVTTGPVRDMVVHARRKRRDHAEAVARRLSAKYPEAFRVWEETERDWPNEPGVRLKSSSVVVTYEGGEAK